MLKIFNEFERRPDLLARFDALLPTYSISCIFADVMYRQSDRPGHHRATFRRRPG